MSIPTEREAFNLIPRQLAGLLGVELEDVDVRSDFPAPPELASEVDLVLDALQYQWVVEWKRSGSLASTASAAKQLVSLGFAPHTYRTISMLVVPFMSSTAAERCEEMGVAWMDLSGNAHIEAPGLRIHVEGKPNRYPRLGRPSNMFASKSSRVARFLLRFPEETFLQREIAEQADLSEGYTSRIVNRLQEASLIYRDRDGKVGVREPGLLLDAWAENYRFDKHHIRRGIVSARSGEALMRQVAEVFADRDVDYAATGLAGTWLVDPFASFRTASFYVRKPLRDDDLETLRFHEGERGSNLWLISPSDDGVFHGAESSKKICHVHPIQLYLDLQHHPERSDEAAEHLRKTCLKW
jgi:hypothetical protein